MPQDEALLKRKIIKTIKAEMKRRSLSQNDLGQLCGGISRTHVNRILNEADSVSFKRLLEMAHALKLKVDLKISRGNV